MSTIEQKRHPSASRKRWKKIEVALFKKNNLTRKKVNNSACIFSKKINKKSKKKVPFSPTYISVVSRQSEK